MQSRFMQTLKRTFRIALYVLASMVLVVLVAAASLLLRPVRDRVLSTALGKARASLPGVLVIGDARWTAPGRIEVEDAAWIDAGDTLAAVDRLAVSVALRPLVSHRLVVRDCTVFGLEADVVAIKRRFAGPDSAAAGQSREAPGGFLRPGSLPGVPAIAVEHLEITAPRVRVAGSAAVQSIGVLAAIDVLDGRPPRIMIDRLRLTDSAGRFGADAKLSVDVDTGILTGGGTGSLGAGCRASFDLRSPRADAFDLRVTMSDSAGANTGDVTLDVAAGLSRVGLDVRSIEFQGSLRVPARDSLPTFLQRRGEKLPPFSAIEAGFNGLYHRDGAGTSTVALHVDERPPFGGLVARMTFRGGSALLDTLTARVENLVVGCAGAFSSDGRLNARLDAGGTIRNVALTRLRLRLEAPSVSSPPYYFDGSVTAAGLRLATGATIERPGGWRIDLQPLVLTGADAAAPTAAGRGGEIRVGEGGDVRVRGLVLTGHAGRYVLNGQMSRERRGEFRLDCDWGEPPVLLLERLLPDAAKRAEVAAAWPAEVGGTISTTADLSPGGRDVRGAFRFSAPGWIDSGFVRVQYGEGDARVDTAVVAAAGFRLRAGGEMRGGEWNARADVALEAGGIVERVAPGVAGLVGEARVQFDGTPDAPRIETSLRAAYDGHGLRVPTIVASGRWLRDRLSVRVSCPDGVTSGTFVLDSLTATFDSHQKQLLPATVSIGAGGRDLKYMQRFHLEGGDEWVLDTDSLGVELKGQRLQNRRPFRLRVHPERTRVSLEEVDLYGSLGTLYASGFAQPDSSDIRVRVDVELPPKPASLTLPDELWPGRVTLSLTAYGENDVVGSLLVSDIDLADETGLTARVDAKAAGDSVECDVVLSGAGRDLITGTFDMPGTVDVFPPRAALGNGPISARLDLKDFPIPDRDDFAIPGGSGREVASLDGSIRIDGTGSKPQAGADVTVSFPPGSPLENYRVDIAAFISSWTLPGDVPERIREGDTAGLLAKLDPTQGVGFVAAARAKKKERPLAAGVFRLPLHWSLSPPSVALYDDRPVVVRCSSDGLILAEIAPLLPKDVGVEGVLDVDLAAEGPVANTVLSGWVRGKDLSFSHADGTRVAGKGELRLTGTGASPVITGEIQIANGVIAVPEKTKHLHPTEGESALWRTMAATQEDSSVTATQGDGTSAAPAKPRLGLDITLVIPSALWIRGKGLDVELAGNLTLTQTGAVPTVAGELNAVRGQLLFLGRTFVITRGKAVFYGEDNINPSLDLELATTVDGVLITVNMSGTVEKPEVALSSEPPMAEADIMSFLVFGKRMDELNSDQVGLVQQRAAETAATFGTQLASRLSRQMRVDLIRLSKGESTGQSTLTIGKYVTRRALLKYEQSLEERATFLIDVEYFLTQTLRLETFMGQQQQSGLEVNWTRDY